MKKGLIITAAAVGILWAGMGLVPLVFQGKIVDLVKQEGNKMLNAQFDFRDLDLSLFRDFPRATVTLEDFWLKGTGAFAGDTLMQAGEITATVNLLSLFGNTGYDISKISISDTRLHAIVLPDGQVNWDVMKEDTVGMKEEDAVPTQEDTPFRIKLQKLDIDDLHLIYDNRQSILWAEVCKLDVVCSGDLTNERTLLNVEADTESLTYRIKGIPFLNRVAVGAKMDLDADLVNRKFTLKDNNLRLNAIEAGIDGWVAMEDSALCMDLDLHTNDVGFKEILSLIPAIYQTEFASLQTAGTARLIASAKGVLQGDTVPAFQLAMQVNDGMFRYPSLPAGVEQINLKAHVKNPGGSIDQTTVSVEPFSFVLAGHPFSMTAWVRTPVSDPDFKIEAKGLLDLGMIHQVYPLKDTKLNGRITADMQLAGRLSYLDKEQFDRMVASGTVGLTGMKLQTKDLPDVEILQSLLTFTPKYLQLSETTVTLGKNDLTLDSRFENYMGYALKGTTLKGNLNVRSNSFNLNDFMISSASDSTDVAVDTLAVADVETVTKDSVQVAAGVIEVPRNVDFEMNAQLQQVRLGKMIFEQLNGKLLVRNAKVDMTNLSMNTMGGNVVMNGSYSTADVKKPVLTGRFQLKDIAFAKAYQELDMVQQMAPIFENLQGEFSGNLQMTADLDQTMSLVLPTLQGKGSLSTHNLSLSGVKAIDRIADAVKRPQLKQMTVNDMTLDFMIENGRIHTAPFDLKMGDYSLNLSGSTGMDQTIDYAGKIKLPETAGSLSQLSTLDFKLGGTFESPQVSLDAKSMATQAVEKIADQTLQKLGEKLNLDSATLANKDSLKQQLQEKVTEKALDFLKKFKK